MYTIELTPTGVNPQTHGLHFEKEVLVGRLPTYIMMIMGLYRS